MYKPCGVGAGADVDVGLRAGVDRAGVPAADHHAPGASRHRTTPLGNRAIVGEGGLVCGTSGGGFFIRFEFDEAAGDQLVELLAEMELQLVDVLVAGVKVAQGIQLPLERPQAHQILLISAAGVDRRILEVGEDERFTRGLELAESSLELLGGVLSDLGEEQQDEQIALANGPVVLVLQAGLRHHVEKIFPHDEFEKDTFGIPLLTLIIDETLEFLPVFLQFRGGREENLLGPHGVGLRLAAPHACRVFAFFLRAR